MSSGSRRTSCLGLVCRQVCFLRSLAWYLACWAVPLGCSFLHLVVYTDMLSHVGSRRWPPCWGFRFSHACMATFLGPALWRPVGSCVSALFLPLHGPSALPYFLHVPWVVPHVFLACSQWARVSAFCCRCGPFGCWCATRRPTGPAAYAHVGSLPLSAHAFGVFTLTCTSSLSALVLRL